MWALFILIFFINGIQAWDMVLEGPKNVPIGKSFSLFCNATELDSKPGDIVWYKGYERLVLQGRIVVSSLVSPRAITSKLTVKNVTTEDSGTYKCWLSNDKIRQITVTVVDQPRAGPDSGAMGRCSAVTELIFFTLLSIVSCHVYF